MDKYKIKSFAIWARRSLIKSVSEKAYSIGIYEDKILEATAVQGGFKLEGKEEIFTLSKKDRDALVKQVNEKGFEQVMEEVAYTWFNRFMGLRYMEVNDYLPTGVRILSSEVEEKKEPDVLTKVSEIIDELNLNANEIYNLLDTGNTLDREKAYRIILVKQCNELGKIIPQMFEKISDYTELLLPDNLLEEGSVIRRMVEDIEESDWLEDVEIVGWMYQYYNTENNELVYDGSMKRNKIPKELLPAATQIFTPDWVVKYMVQNSLGNLIYSSSDNCKKVVTEWEYFINQEKDVNQKIVNIEEVKIIDPAMGSGHILVCAFDLLMDVYQAYGYNERESTKLILKNNLYGFDIDDRASQIANFAIIMRARKYNRRIFREKIETKLFSIKQSNDIDNSLINFVTNNNEELAEDLEYIVNIFKDAKEYGSILNLKTINYEKLDKAIISIVDNSEGDLILLNLRDQVIYKLIPLINQAKMMTTKYDVVVTNPPYLNSSRMSEKLLKYVNDNYPNTKSDFSMIFYEKAINDYCKKDGYISFVTTTSWMFLKSFEEIRKKAINELEFESLVDFGTELFDGKVGHNPIVAWVNKNCMPTKDMIAVRLVDFCYKRREEKKTEFFNLQNRFTSNQKKFAKIPSMPIAYWVSNKFLDNFSKGISIDNISDFTGSQNKTADNEKYLRYFWEVENNKIGKNQKWVSYAKGGEYRKYYGNLELVVDWSDEARNFYKTNKTSNLLNERYWFKEGITYTMLTTKGTSFRYYPSSGVFDMGGPTICYLEHMEYILGLLNSKITKLYLNVMNPTLNLQAKDLKALPIIISNENIDFIKQKVVQNINISMKDWDNYEISYNFKKHPLLMLLEKNISKVFYKWDKDTIDDFNTLKSNEEEINRIFIDIYGLENELNSEINDNDITIRKADRERDIKSFISYAIGCMLGRYSIDSEGLIYAGGDFNDKWNINDKKVRKIEKNEDGNIISDSWIDSRFMPDKDNIIPITEDEYFEDDIVSRFIEFVKTVYGNDTLEENLDFIADSIGRKASETARQAIRRYFIKDFYKDHLKVYQKRPIYWMFESGKNDGFKCLVYMHRYNEQTVAKVRTDYLHTLQRKYESEINRLQLVVDSEEYNAKDRTAAKKKIDRISKQIEECREYDQVVAHLANEKISIDLDDGVKVNYAKFQDVKIINSKGKEVKMNLLAKI